MRHGLLLDVSSPKESARDLRYGRRAGRWAGPNVDELLDAVHSERIAALRRDRLKPRAELDDPRNREWPIESLEIWREIAKDPKHPQHAKALAVVAIADVEPRL